MKTLYLLGIAILLLPTITPVILGQKTDKTLARFTVIAAKDGMQKQFEDGYKRHLQWHIENGERWNWYGWFIASGNRLGYFVDATFGHTWSDFDQPIDPKGDIADISMNVLPYARFQSQFTCSYLPQVSSGTEANSLSVTLPQTLYFKIRPGRELGFERFLAEFHKEMESTKSSQDYLWYRIEEGGESPRYLLFLPHNNFSDKQRSQNLFAGLWVKNVAAQSLFDRSVLEVTSETLRYRPDMTFIPKQP